MKKGLVLFALINLIFLTDLSISAQKFNFKINPGLIKAQVRYSNIEAFSDGQGALIEWETEFESKNLGFYVYRVVGDQKELVNDSLIPGTYLKTRGEQTLGNTYTFFDPQGDLSSTYVIESLDLNGQRFASNQVSTRYIGNANSVAAETFKSSKRDSGKANPVILKNEMILPKDLQGEVEENTAQADSEMQKWVAAQPGVKIGIQREGIYRVSRTELQSAGFNVDAPPALWQLYVNGVQQSIIVGSNGAYIEFYGKGIDTRESNTQTYFLVVGTQNGKRIGNSFRRAIASPVVSNSYLQSFVFKERKIYSPSVINGDTDNFFGRVVNDTSVTIPLSLQSIDFAAANSSIDITVQGLVQIQHQIKVTLNGTELGSFIGYNYDSIKHHFDIPTSLLQEGVNNLQLVALNGSSDINYFDTVKINYKRKYQAGQNQLSFYTPNYRASYVEGFTSANIRVFDVSSPDSPSLINNLPIQENNGTYRVYLPANRGRVMFAVEDSAVSQVASISLNSPSTLSTASHNAELVIISYKDWMTEANNWADYRRAQGMTVEVVNVEDVYDEFNFGVFSSDAIKGFLQYAKNNWQTPPNYAFLLGDATFDPRNYTGNGVNNYIPTKMVETVYTEAPSDEALADFNDDGLSEIAIGRIPAQTAQDVTQALNKTKLFEQTVGEGFQRGALFASDLPEGYDFEGSSARLANLLPSTITKVFINRSLTDARTQLLTQLNSGKFLVNYSGHGNTNVWASPSFFSGNDAANLSNGSKLSLFTMLTCLNGQFTNQSDSLSEKLLKNPNGGAVAVWSSTALTTPDVQDVMAAQFYSQIAAGNITRLGDLIKDAKTVLSGGRDVRLSWALLGDPTLKVK